MIQKLLCMSAKLQRNGELSLAKMSSLTWYGVFFFVVLNELAEVGRQLSVLSFCVVRFTSSWQAHHNSMMPITRDLIFLHVKRCDFASFLPALVSLTCY